MADMEADYRQKLEAELALRKRKNPRYSLRAFAAFLSVDVSYLSRLRAGRLILSVDLAASFAKRLGLSGKERADFILSAAEEQKCHALHLIDPSLTDCDPARESTNQAPAPRKRSPSKKKGNK